MKLLLDQNIAPSLVTRLEEGFPGTAHVSEFNLERASDESVWAHALEGDFAIVSKDGDFHQLSFLRGPPPKVIWIRLGNCTTDQILDLLLAARARIDRFLTDESAALMTLP